MTWHILTSGLCLMGLIGVVANNYRHRICFILWMFSNAGFVVVDVAYTGLWERALLHATYFGLAIHGWHAWKVKR